MPGVTENKYCCDCCDVGYSHIEDHRTKCPHRFVGVFCCLGDTPCPPDGSSIYCPHCKSYFKSTSCHQRHLDPYSPENETTVCSLMDQCTKCQTCMSKNLPRNHKCGGRKWCKICRKIVNKDQSQCFVQLKPAQNDRKNYNSTFISTLNVLKEKGFMSPTYVWLIAYVSIVITYLWTNRAYTVKLWDRIDRCSSVPRTRDLKTV